MQKLLTVKQLSNLLSIHPVRVYIMVRENEIPCIRLGEKLIRFDPEAIERWREHMTTGPRFPRENH